MDKHSDHHPNGSPETYPDFDEKRARALTIAGKQIYQIAGLMTQYKEKPESRMDRRDYEGKKRRGYPGYKAKLRKLNKFRTNYFNAIMPIVDFALGPWLDQEYLSGKEKNVIDQRALDKIKSLAQRQDRLRNKFNILRSAISAFQRKKHGKPDFLIPARYIQELDQIGNDVISEVSCILKKIGFEYPQEPQATKFYPLIRTAKIEPDQDSHLGEVFRERYLPDIQAVLAMPSKTNLGPDQKVKPLGIDPLDDWPEMTFQPKQATES